MENLRKRIKISPGTKIILGFISIILLGAFLLSLPISNTNGKWLNAIDALFTSTSGVCVTGLQTVDASTTYTTFGKIILLLLIQIGGLGIITITSLIFLILGKKINLKNRLTIQESINKDTMQGVVKFIKKIIIITFIIEGIGALCLLYSCITITDNFWTGLFNAIFLAVSSFCNAGFDIIGSPDNIFASLTPFATNVLLLLPIIMLIVVGGIGFVVLIDGWKSKKIKQHSAVVLIITTILLLLGFIIFLICEWNNPATLGNMSFGEKILNAFFQSTTSRTAGFATLDQASLTKGSKITTMILMFIGASPNSTAGGIKTTTLFILLLFLFRRTNNNGDIHFAGRKISNNIISKALKITLYAMLFLFIAVITIRIIEPSSIGLEEIIFECISALSTTGLSLGITPILTGASKIILTILMFMGRIALTTLALAISTKNTEYDKIEFPNTDIIVG
ncbi:MAG: hypothetical protein E7361_00600 [Clostridiales bacterium]|nr:hypothetical protein [Clostridiales bacterium]